MFISLVHIMRIGLTLSLINCLFVVTHQSDEQAINWSNSKRSRTSISANADGPRDAAYVKWTHIALPTKYNYQATSREEISKKIFSILRTEPTSCLHHLLPQPREPSVISRLRIYQKYPRVYTRTKRYYSFIHYALNYYQDSISNISNH